MISVPDLVVQIVAPTGRDSELLSEILSKRGLANAADSGAILSFTALERDRSGAWLIAEEALTPQIIEHLADLLASQPLWSDLPVLILTTSGRETTASLQRRWQLRPLGHITLLERPLRPATLVSAVETALRARSRQYEIRAANQERDRAYAELHRSEQQNRLILASTHDCIKLLDLEGNLLSMNEEGQRRLGIEDFSRVCNASWFSFWRSGDRDAARRACEKALSGEAGRFEGFYQTPAGEATWWDISVTPVRDESSNIINLLAVSREITDRKLAEKALLQSEKLAAVGRLASSIAHEINNPLEAITNLIFLARQYAILPEVQAHLAAADQELRRVSVIATQTLRFHRQASKPRAVTAEELFATVLSIYEGRLRNSSIQVEEQYKAKSKVVCFEGDVRQVLSNLVGNAIDAMSGGGRLLIRSHEATDWRKGRPGVTLTVADTGAGMSPAVAARIFEPFFTTKGIGGTGLGLWVSKDVVARHDGSLRLRTRQQHDTSGTVFRFFIPYAA